MPNLRLADLTAEIEANVRRALLEDIGSGDITAQLIPAERLAKATIITREAAVIAGTAWVDAVFRQLDPRVAVHWQVADGERVSPNQALFHLEGPARSLLTGERSALNFLQLLSGVATRAQFLADFHQSFSKPVKANLVARLATTAFANAPSVVVPSVALFQILGISFQKFDGKVFILLELIADDAQHDIALNLFPVRAEF